MLHVDKWNDLKWLLESEWTANYNLSRLSENKSKVEEISIHKSAMTHAGKVFAAGWLQKNSTHWETGGKQQHWLKGGDAGKTQCH